MIILVRPEQSLPKSLASFQQHGIACRGIAVQTIDVNPALRATLHADIAAFKQTPNDMRHHLFDTAIVTSRYAADGLVTELNVIDCGLSEFAKSFIAVGQSTAKPLRQHNNEVPIVIPQQHDSEGVLSLPELLTVNSQHIALIKGVGGRELIARALASRGASITEYPVYQRRSLDIDLNVIANESDTINLVVVTSGEAATILLNSTENKWFKSKPWLVISERVAKLVRQQGVRSVYISAGASDSALIKCVQEIME